MLFERLHSISERSWIRQQQLLFTCFIVLCLRLSEFSAEKFLMQSFVFFVQRCKSCFDLIKLVRKNNAVSRQCSIFFPKSKFIFRIEKEVVKKEKTSEHGNG